MKPEPDINSSVNEILISIGGVVGFFMLVAGIVSCVGG